MDAHSALVRLCDREGFWRDGGECSLRRFARQAFCYVKSREGNWQIPHAHTACTRFFPRSHPQNDPREDSASCFSFALIRIRAASRSFCMDAHSALVKLYEREGFWGGRMKVLASALHKTSILLCEIKGER